MHKHLNVIPAAVIFFFDLEWDNLKWKEKQAECSAKVQQIRFVAAAWMILAKKCSSISINLEE